MDKDILNKGNKVYSEDNCVFVPARINSLFLKNDVDRGKYPIGITEWNDIKNNKEPKLMVQINILNKRKRKYFPLSKPFQAFTYYKNFKENYIKQVADEYRDLIPKKLYDAMYEYKVEIND